MTGTDDTRTRLTRAAGPGELLSAACQAFELILSLTRACHDPSGEWYVPMVLAAPSAASVRDRLTRAPSFPPPPARPRTTARETERGAAAAERVASLCQALAMALTGPAATSGQAGDQHACAAAAHSARQISALLSGPS